MRRICRVLGVPENGVALDTLISELTKQNVMTELKAKRARAAAGLRTSAAHARWEEIQLSDVNPVIEFTRELMAAQLGRDCAPSSSRSCPSPPSLPRATLRPGIAITRGPPSPPCHNAQALDVPRKRINVAGCRCYRASSLVRPCWDPAVPCCSPLASVVGAGPSAVPSGEHPSAAGPVPLGSAARWYPSPTWGHGRGAYGECLPHGGRARDGALAALLRSTTLQLPQGKKEHSFLPRPLDQNPGPWVCPYYKGLNPAHRGWDPAYPSSFRPMDWLTAPRLARRAPARQSPRRHSRDALFSSVTSDDDHFGSSLNLGAARC